MQAFGKCMAYNLCICKKRILYEDMVHKQTFQLNVEAYFR